MTEPSEGQTPQTDTPQIMADDNQQNFFRLEQLNMMVVILGFIVLATPVLFILASIGTGGLGLVITLVWLILIATSFGFARQAKRRGYLGR